MPTSWSSIAEWPMNVDGTNYSEGKYEVHSWLKDSFNKPLYAGSDIIHFDNNSPVFEATLLRSNAVIIDLVINDLTFDYNKFSQDLITNPILINDNFSIGDTKPDCSGKIQLQELGDNVSNKCIPFESQPLWGIDSDNISKNFLRIRAPELVQSLEHFVTIDGTMMDCSGNISIADQTTSFTTVDMGGPSIVSVSVETNNSNNNKLSKINDNIIVKFLSSEKLSNHPNSTTANGQDNYPPPTVTIWVGNRSNDNQSVLAVLDTTDPTGRSWTATFNTTNALSTWTSSTLQEGDNISFSIHDYFDLNYDQQVGWAENPGVDIISTDDNLTISGVYDGLSVIFDNQPPDNISMSQLVSNNPLIDRFRPDEKAYFDFKVNEPIYPPEIQIGGHDNVTVVNSDNATPYLNDNLTWYAEKIFLDNYTSNNNVFADITFEDLAGNTVTRTTNSIVFDNSLDNLSNVSLVTSNPARLDNGTHQRYFAKESDNITLSFQANEPIQILSLEFGNEVFDNSSSNLSNPTGFNWEFNYEVTNSINFDNSSHNPLKFKIIYTDLVKNDNLTIENTNNSSLVEIDITPPTLDNVTIFSSNRNPEWAKSQDNVTLAFISNEPLKNRFNNQLRCNPSYNTICDDSIIVMAGDDNNSSGQTLQVLQNNGVLDYKRYSATRIFQTSSPLTSQHGDNVTFTIDFMDYAGNLATVNATTDSSNVKYDDQKPDLTRIEISRTM